MNETIPRTLDLLLTRLLEHPKSGVRVEAWLFEGPERRRSAERLLAARGITAVLRSAYKPLVHFFLEEAQLAGARRIAVRYPVPGHADGRRFLLEAYPLAGLLRGIEISWTAGDDPLHYHVALERPGGDRATYRVFAPNRVRTDHLGAPVLAPTGWLRITGTPDGRGDADEALETDYEILFRRTMDAVRARDWGLREPYFDRLSIRAEIPHCEHRLPYGDECISTGEALHEDLYFSMLEFFKHRAGRPADDRTIQPGQIVPDIRYTEGTPGVRVALESAFPEASSAAAADGTGSADTAESLAPARVLLDTADRPLTPVQISAELAVFEGQRFAAQSKRGCAVQGIYRPSRRPAILITAGQHANETTGVVGALRAARRLAAGREASFALVPVENPDGYALHQWLCATHPRHMHHAARYTALGDDLQARSREPWFEKGARLEGQRLSGAGFHINLHGYPAHEWTRPLTGYLPRGFQTWSIPKGFYLIVRHRREWAARVPAFLERLTGRLARVPGLAAFNRAQLETSCAHAGERPAPILHDIPCQITEDEQAAFPLGLITEFPDETIYGGLFVLAHTAQMETVLAAEEIYAEMA